MSSDRDFKLQKEINGILSDHNPVATVLGMGDLHMVPESALKLRHPMVFSKTSDGRVHASPFQVKRQHQKVKKEESVDVSTNVRLQQLIEQRKNVLAARQLKHVVGKRLNDSVFRVRFTKSGGSDPYNNASTSVSAPARLPPIGQTKKKLTPKKTEPLPKILPPTTNSNAMNASTTSSVQSTTLHTALRDTQPEYRDTFVATVETPREVTPTEAPLVLPPATRSRGKRKSFFFTSVDVPDDADGPPDPSLPTPTAAAASHLLPTTPETASSGNRLFANNNSLVSQFGPMEQSKSTIPSLSTTPMNTGGGKSLSFRRSPRRGGNSSGNTTPRNGESTTSTNLSVANSDARERQQRMIQQFPKFRASEVLGRSQSAIDEQVKSKKKMNVSAAHNEYLLQSRKESDEFYRTTTRRLERTLDDRRSRYFKKFSAVDLNKELPFHATANAILHHVEKVISRDEQNVAKEEEHEKNMESYGRVLSFAESNLHHPAAFAVLQTAKPFIAKGPKPEYFHQHVMPSVSKTDCLFDDVCTVVVHVASIFEVSRADAFTALRKAAGGFVGNRAEELSAAL